MIRVWNNSNKSALPSIFRISIPKLSSKINLDFWRFFSLSLFALYWHSSPEEGNKIKQVVMPAVKKNNNIIIINWWQLMPILYLRSFVLFFSSWSFSNSLIRLFFSISFCSISDVISAIMHCFSCDDSFLCCWSEYQGKHWLKCNKRKNMCHNFTLH